MSASSHPLSSRDCSLSPWAHQWGCLGKLLQKLYHLSGGAEFFFPMDCEKGKEGHCLASGMQKKSFGSLQV